MRLDRFLASEMGLGSRTDIKKMIRTGRVAVNGDRILRPELSIDPGSAVVTVDGQEMIYRKLVYLMLNKPAGYVSATEDSRYPTVCDLVPEELRHLRLFPMGRLDIDTEGLCILTNDGQLSHRLLSPKNHIPKTYLAELDKPPEAGDAEQFKEGIVLDDGFRCAPAELFLSGGNLAEVIIYEGKFHQVKRMFESVGKRVVYLRRIKMNRLCLDESLGAGEMRELTAEELELLSGRSNIHEEDK